MFQGTIPQGVRAILHEAVGTWGVDEVFVGCSGNFTIERLLLGKVQHLHSNDVSIYTTALGLWASGQDVPITLKPEHREDLAWLEKGLDNGVGTVATLMLGTRFLASHTRAGNVWHDRQVEAYRSQWSRLHHETVLKLEASGLRVDSFHPMDVLDWLKEHVPADGAVCSFPPFWAGGYETMFKPLSDHFDWPEPEYPVMDENRKLQLLHTLMDRPNWLIGLMERWSDIEEHLVGQVQQTNRNVPIYVYSSHSPTRLVLPHQKTAPVFAPRLMPEETIGDRVSIAPLSDGQFNTLRSQYLNTKIKPGSPLLACAVCVDGVVVGSFAFLAPSLEPDRAYLMSDFPVAPTLYPKLSRLIVMVAMSTEAQSLMQRATSRRISGLATTAFTNNPSSMKYRGLLEVANRGEKDGVKFVNYRGPMGEWTAQEALDAWKAKQGVAA